MSDVSDAMQQKAKSFFQRPEGKTGMLFLFAALAAAGYGLFLVLPALIILLQNLIYAGVLCGALFAAVVVISNPRFRTLCSYMFKSVMRFFTGLVIEIDPIGILNGYVEDLQKRLGDMKESMRNLAGQVQKLKNIISSNEARRVHSLEIAKQAHDSKDTSNKVAFVLQSRQAGRLGKSNLTLQALLNKMVAMQKVLQKMYEVSEFTVQDISGEVEVKTQERNAIMASHNAFKSALRIIQGGTDQKALFDQTMQFLADDYATKVGEIEQFMNDSQGFIKSVDLENGVYEQEALDQIEKWSDRADQLFLRVDTGSKVGDTSSYANVSDVQAQAEAEAEAGNFSDLFGKSNQ